MLKTLLLVLTAPLWGPPMILLGWLRERADQKEGEAFMRWWKETGQAEDARRSRERTERLRERQSA